MSGLVAVTLLNRSDKSASIDLDLESLGFDLSHIYTIRDLWKHKDYPVSKGKTQNFEIPPHGVITLKIKGIISNSLHFLIFHIFHHWKKVPFDTIGISDTDLNVIFFFKARIFRQFFTF